VNKIVIATRGSKLALTQSTTIAEALRALPGEREVELKIISTIGDRVIDRPLPEIGGKGLFTAELEEALLKEEADLAVHSLKDLPVEDSDDFEVAAIPERAPANDSLVSREELTTGLPERGMTVATGSARRASQIMRLVPGITIVPVRGNVDTRLRKLAEGQFDVLMLAAAGLARLGIEPEHILRLNPSEFLPAPAQGALGIQIKRGRPEIKALIEQLDHSASRLTATSERTLLAGLGGGCSIPVGAYAELKDGRLTLVGGVFSPDGKRAFVEDIEGHGESAEELGSELARKLLTAGADEILKECDV
jgi:hydroxymethylbilane synthase